MYYKMLQMPHGTSHTSIGEIKAHHKTRHQRETLQTPIRMFLSDFMEKVRQLGDLKEHLNKRDKLIQESIKFPGN